jgi:hypothetical protein
VKGGGQCIYFWSFTHIIEFLMNIWWQLILIRSQIIIWSYLCDQNWWNIIKKKYRYKFSSAFIDLRLPNMVKRLFADVIHDAICLMNIHEQKYPWFLAMWCQLYMWKTLLWHLYTMCSFIVGFCCLVIWQFLIAVRLWQISQIILRFECCRLYIVTVCVFVRHLFSFYPFYFDFHSASIIFDVSSGFYLWNINKTTAWHL